MKRLLTFFVFAVTFCAVSLAQKDMTSYIVNPDFEDDPHTNGWTRSGFGPHSGGFELAHGTTFMENWSGHGSTLGDASISQILYKLPPGTYTLTVAAHNIQQGNNNSPEKGAFVFANDQRTEFGKDDDYSVSCVSHDGTLTIGVVLDGCTGNWVAIDNFRLSMTEVAADLRPFIQQYVDEANSVDQQNDSPERTELINARDALLRYLDDTSLNDGISDAFVRLKDAIKAYTLSVASETTPYNMTDKIINPSFEDSSKGWKATDMGFQTNSGYGNLRVGSRYCEHWVENGGAGSCSIMQELTGLPAGDYKLTANAFNITQGNESLPNTGAFLVADAERKEVSVVNTYIVKFTVIGGTADIGFVCQNATGNWVAVDNFQLFYLGSNPAKNKQILEERIAMAESLANEKMGDMQQQELQTAIDQAKAATTDEEIDAAAVSLKSAYKAAGVSVDAYARLGKVISDVERACSNVSGSNGKTEMDSAIADAKSVYQNGSSTYEEMQEAAIELENQLFAYRVANGSGTAPIVTWDKVVVHGSRGACGRMEAVSEDSEIIERGFCWSTSPVPTISDNHSSLSYSFNGDVYVMYMEPATKYYVRPYAITDTYAVGYGEPTKIITGFESDITYGFNWGAPTQQDNEECIAAMETAVQYLRDWTSIVGFRPYLNYEIGKWGADCGYGGWISAGESYARNPGVLLHEMGHGIGVGQHWRYTADDSPLHPSRDEKGNSNIYWRGERANRVFKFFENQPDEYNADGTLAHSHSIADGDRVHVCYGLSGVTAPIDLLRQAVFYQGMYEDGMPAVSDGACPFYSFDCEDDEKYYITNEKYGFGEKFLTVSGSRLTYRKATRDEAKEDDAYAWTIEYVPTTGLYFLKNVKSGSYLSYSSSNFVVKSTETPSNSEKIQLMPARVTAEYRVGDETIQQKTYWMVRGTRVETPEALTIATSSASAVSAPALNFWDNSQQQHWAILSSDDMDKVDKVYMDFDKRRLEELLAGSKKLLATPHELINPEETTADSDFQTIVNTTEENKPNLNTATVYSNAVKSFTTEISNYLQKVQPTSMDNPFDLTFLIDDPTFLSGSSWDGLENPESHPLEYNSTAFSISQTLSGTPRGTYMLVASGFQSPGRVYSACSEYKKGTNNVSATVTVTYGGNSVSQKLAHVYEGGQEEKLGEGGLEIKTVDLYTPQNAAAAKPYLEHGFYETSLIFHTNIKTMTITLQDKKATDKYWTMLGGVKLYYYGTEITKDEVTGIEDIYAEADAIYSTEVQAYYNVNGVQIPRPLAKGITIIRFKDGHTKKIIR